MANNLLLLNIGTGHGSDEKTLIHTKLRLWSRYADIGTVGNHMRAGTSTKGRKKDNLFIKKPRNGGWKVTNEGQSLAATGMKDQTKANVKLIKELHKNHGGVVNMFIVGHSRGCILSLRIAATVYEDLPQINAYLFLIDPVKRMSRGTDFYNRQIHANVKDIQIIAMEDETSASVFPIMSVRRKEKGKKYTEVDSEDYIRMPGGHGTATQVDGHPIGQTAAKLALRFLGDRHGIPFDVPMPDNLSLNSSYMRINTVNPIGPQGLRSINDDGNTKYSKAGIRDLSSFKSNKWHGSGFFINEHHFDIFKSEFSYAFMHVICQSLTNGFPPYDDDHLKRQLGFEYRQWLRLDPNGAEAMKKLKAAHKRLKAHCGIN